MRWGVSFVRDDADARELEYDRLADAIGQPNQQLDAHAGRRLGLRHDGRPPAVRVVVERDTDEHDTGRVRGQNVAIIARRSIGIRSTDGKLSGG